jgi:polysaccharide export outer membrane protein
MRIHIVQILISASVLAFFISSGLHAQYALAGAQQLPQGPSNAPAVTVPQSRSNTSVAPEDISDMKLMPGSMVDIHVFEETDLDGAYRIDDRGDISMPVGGLVHVASLSLRDAETAVSEKLRTAQILNNAHVLVNIDEYSAHNVVVLGEVTTPGRFPILARRKLDDVLAMAGGETSMAGNTITLHRFGQPPQIVDKINYRRNADIRNPLDVTINPGDTVYVRKAGVVYVLGAVNRPGGYLMQEDGELNISEALSLAFGTSSQAVPSKTRVFRKMPDGSVVVLPVDYKKISKGRAKDIQMHAEDVVYVPPSTIKSVLVSGNAVLAATASASIYTLR